MSLQRVCIVAFPEFAGFCGWQITRGHRQEHPGSSFLSLYPLRFTRRLADAELENHLVLGLAAGLTIGLLATMTGTALAAGGTSLCIPEAANTATVTPTGGACKTGYKFTLNWARKEKKEKQAKKAHPAKKVKKVNFQVSPKRKSKHSTKSFPT
jgi:hypothetical protein